MSTGVKVLIFVAALVVVASAPTQAADLVADLVAGVLAFVRSLG